MRLHGHHLGGHDLLVKGQRHQRDLLVRILVCVLAQELVIVTHAMAQASATAAEGHAGHNEEVDAVSCK